MVTQSVCEGLSLVLWWFRVCVKDVKEEECGSFRELASVCNQVVVSLVPYGTECHLSSPVCAVTASPVGLVQCVL